MTSQGYIPVSGNNEANPFAGMGDTDTEDDPRGVVIHLVPENSPGRWSHVEDLDSFFTRNYIFHQKGGFRVMMLDEFLQNVIFVGTIGYLYVIFNCIDYDLLFDNKPNPNNTTKTTIDEIFYSYDQCLANTSGFTLYYIFPVCFIICFFKFAKWIYHAYHFNEIKHFYENALKIPNKELENYPWHDVQKRLLDVQREQRICIHKENLTELDVYHRILRFDNYLVAMSNNNLIPSRIRIPIVGECTVLSSMQISTIKILLFYGPLAFFENNWHLKDEYRNNRNRAELAKKLSRSITIYCLVLTVLSVISFMWKVIVCFFNNVETGRRDPSTLVARSWSLEGKLRLRHYNELDHELAARLSRAYRPASDYMNSFTSPMVAVIASFFAYTCGAISFYIIVLGIWDKDVFNIEHIITIASVCAAVVIIAQKLIKNENEILNPEQLMASASAHLLYTPTEWVGKAHTSKVRNDFGQLFQLKVAEVLTEVCSPFMTPYLLYTQFRPKALDIVDFFRNFTVSIHGVGDVCSFAQMDIRKHGNSDFQGIKITEEPQTPRIEKNTEAEKGKTELSLLHFTLTNPGWKMPDEARDYLDNMKSRAQQDLLRARGPTGALNVNTAMGQSLMALDCIGDNYSAVVNNVLQSHQMTASYMNSSGLQLPSSGHFGVNYFSSPQITDYGTSHNITTDHMHPRSTYLQNITEDEDQVENDQFIVNVPNPPLKHLYKCEGPAVGSHTGFLYSLYGNQQMTVTSPEFTAADICFSATYMRELFIQRMKNKRGLRMPQDGDVWQRSQQTSELPLATTATTTQSSVPFLAHPFGSSTMAAQTSAERTPLLGPKKS